VVVQRELQIYQLSAVTIVL